MENRLEIAFARLNDANITARHEWKCCQTCGCYAMIEEMAQTQARGYAFYHEQDCESAARTGSLHIGYGASGDETTDEQVEAVGREIVAALREAGFGDDEVVWDGTAMSRVKVVTGDSGEFAHLWTPEESDDDDWYPDDEDEDED